MSDTDSSRSRPSRRTIIRDLIVFQVKLWLEGFKDFVLMPLSLGAAILDVIFRWATGGGALYAIMRLGNRFEQWVNLYGALENEKDLSHPIQNTLDGPLDSKSGTIPGESSGGSSRSVGPDEKEKN